MYHLGDLTDSVTDFMVTDITSTTITLSWNPPAALVPISYGIEHRCRRVCESSFGPNERDTSVSSPHQSTDITPYSQCSFILYGVYGINQVLLAFSSQTTTQSTGKSKYFACR